MTTSSSGGADRFDEPPGKQCSSAASSAGSGNAAPLRSQRVYVGTFDGEGKLPRVASYADLASQDGNRVRLTGTDGERDVRMRQAPPPVYLGHVAITLADGTAVGFLTPWSQDGPRPQAEIDELAGKKVEVVGNIFLRGVPHPEGGAAPMSPTIVDVKALRLAR
ncbi:MAG TPA: hypothetical protein VHE35_15845 [Kofleriaceae bacterium]|nr:hypothetical protein [Kofleriaceae bacterium]